MQLGWESADALVSEAGTTVAKFLDMASVWLHARSVQGPKRVTISHDFTSNGKPVSWRCWKEAGEELMELLEAGWSGTGPPR